MLGSSSLFLQANSASSSLTTLLPKVAFAKSSAMLLCLCSVGVATAESGPGLSEVGDSDALLC